MKNIFTYSENEKVGFIEPSVILESNRRAEIDKVSAIEEYTSQRVRMNLGKIILTIEGDDLSIGELSSERVTLTGSILSLSFSS